MRRTPILLLVISALGCSEGTPAPTDPIGSSGPQRAAVVSSGEGTFTFHAVHYWACVGEVVENSVEAPYRWHLVETPQGDFVYHDHWDQKTVEGTLVGQTTGTVWRRVQNGGPFIQRSTGGGMVQWAFHGWFVTDTGPDIRVHEVFHASRNANGELVAQRYDFSCEAHPNR